jgi:hypothetical protein
MLTNKDNPRSINLCTLFDSNFLLQGLALIESIEKSSTLSITWTVLALDNKTENFLTSINKTNLVILNLHSIQDRELYALIGQRPWREICWTSAACLLNYLKQKTQLGDLIAYVDADCFFYSDVAMALSQLKVEGSIGIHEHRYSKDRLDFLEKSGRFNVGLIAGIRGKNFDDCIDLWRKQVLTDCSVDPAKGKCGDQTYLNEWPELYENTVIFHDKGIGCAPWNVNNYKISRVNQMIKVDSVPLQFFHFHALKIGYFSKRLTIFVPASGYKLNRNEIKPIYDEYIRSLQYLKYKYPNIPIRKYQMNFKWWISNFSKRSLLFSLNFK